MNSLKIKNIKCLQKKDYFSNCDLSKVPTEGRLIAINKKYLAFSSNNPGEIVIADSSKPGYINENKPNIKGIKENILDLEFSPFNNNILSSSYDNNSILIWKIPDTDNDLQENLTKEMLTYNKHKGKVNFINFNPIVEDLIVSTDYKKEIHIWNILKGETIFKLNAEDIPTLVSWSPNGDLIGVPTKNKFVNIFEPRYNKIIYKQKITDSSLNYKFAWIDNNLFVTTNWLKDSYQELKLWDIRKLNQNEITSIQINTPRNGTNISTPFVNNKLNLIYITGKDDNSIKMYDYSEGILKQKYNFGTNKNYIYSVLFDRKILDKNKFEIDRFARYVNNNIYYISFISENKFDDNLLYPSTESSKNRLTYEEWISGKTIEYNTSEMDIFIELEKKFSKEVNKNEEIINSYNEIKNIYTQLETKLKEFDNKLNENNIKEIEQMKECKNKYKEISKKYFEEKNRVKNLEEKIKEIKQKDLKEDNKNKNKYIDSKNKKKEKEENIKKTIKNKNSKGKLNVINENENNKIKELNNIINQYKNKINEQLKIINNNTKIISKYEKENNELKNKLNENNNIIIAQNEIKNNELESQNKIINEEMVKELKEKYENLLYLELKKIKNKLTEEIKQQIEERIIKNEKIFNNNEKNKDKRFTEIIENIKMKYNINKKEEKSNFDKDKYIHNGIKCKKCFQEPIIGYRYKCSICNNFNLCEKCENENLISEEHSHYFIKILKEIKNNDVII